jgi:dienelactone hydrolase
MTVATIAHHALTVEAGELPLTIARGVGTAKALLIVPSAFGVGPDLEAQMLELANDASVVVALDPFFREDAGYATYDERPRVMARLGALDRERAYRDVRAAIAWTKEESAKPVVMIGICFGGPLALLAAADHAVDAIVTWHGSRMENFLARANEMRCPMHHHIGSVDPVVPPAAVDAIRAAFVDHPNARFIVHEGVTHGFSHRAAEQAYNAAAERAGMDSALELIRD